MDGAWLQGALRSLKLLLIGLEPHRLAVVVVVQARAPGTPVAIWTSSRLGPRAGTRSSRRVVDFALAIAGAWTCQGLPVEHVFAR